MFKQARGYTYKYPVNPPIPDWNTTFQQPSWVVRQKLGKPLFPGSSRIKRGRK